MASERQPIENVVLEGRVRNRLDTDERLQIHDLRVFVSDSNVWIDGEVPNLFQRSLAKQVAGQARGVKSVVNRLVIARGARSDEDIAAEVRAALAANSLVNSDRVQVRVKDGTVYLGGQLTSESEKAEAEAVGRLATGAEAVINQIAVERGQSRPDQDIEGDVRADLLQELLLGPSEIDVKVENGVVHLDGSVWNQAGRDRVESVAARTPGVRSVVNKVSVKERRL